MHNDVAEEYSSDDDESENDLEEVDNDYSEETFMDTFLATACMEIPDLSLDNTHKSVSKSIDQSQSLLSDKNETSVNAADVENYDTITVASDNDLGILGLLLSLLLSIVLLI